MIRDVALRTKVGFLVLAMAGSALAQQAPREEGAPAGGEAPPRATVPPLAFKVDWVRPTSQENTKVRYMPVQENVADPNVEVKYYGAAKQILTTGAPGNAIAPYGVWSGTAPEPFAMTFRLKDSYVDLTGLATIRWYTKTSGFHVVRPVVKLANGNMLVGDAEFSSVTMLTQSQFSLAKLRWIKLDPEKVVTLNSGRAAANPNGEIWAPNPDLSKVDEIGFADLMPGSGHGTGGWIQLGGIEVYGKPVPRNSLSASQ
jgi:hypothetical protein